MDTRDDYNFDATGQYIDKILSRMKGCSTDFIADRCLTPLLIHLYVYNYESYKEILLEMEKK